MRTIEFLSDPQLLGWFAPALIVGLAIAVMGGAASVLVVVRRLALVGQGVSHAAFGAVGLGAALGLVGGGAGGAGGGGGDSLLGYLLIVGGFCVASALAMAWIADTRATRFGLREDTVIGVFLVASMAMGAILLKWRVRRDAGAGGTNVVEAWLFGDMFGVGYHDAIAAWVGVAIVLGVLWLTRRTLIFWVFDEAGAEAFGVRVGVARALLLTLLALVIVVSMKLAGVLLATALMVLPGATALRLTDRLWGAQALSIGAAIVGVLAGLVLSFETDWAPGPSIVMVQVGMLALAWPLGRIVRARA